VLPTADAESDPPDDRALFRPANDRRPVIARRIAEGDPTSALRDRLVKAGWSAPAARAVADLNREFIEALAADAPKPFAKLLAELERLGRYPKVMARLADYPDLAGFFAGLADPDSAAAALTGPSADIRTFTSMMMLAPRDQRPALADLFARHGTLVASLHRHGLPGAEALFLDSRAGTDHAGDRVYEDWLAETLDRLLRGPEDELDAFLQIVLEHGPDLRVRLRADAGFRRRFADELWPALERLASEPECPLELFLDDPAMWDVLQREDGEELLRKRGMVAVSVLHGERPWPEAVRDRLVRVLLAGGVSTLEGLLKGPFRNDPRFRDLIAAPNLSDESLVGIIAAIQKMGMDYGPTLEAIVRAKDSAEQLKALLGPPESNVLEWVPFYIHYSVARKLLLEERVSSEEWDEFGMDTLMTAIPFGKLAKTGGKVVTQTLKATVKEEAAKQLTRGAGGSAIRGAAKSLAVGATKGAARTTAQRLAVRWTLTETIRTARKTVKAAMADVSRRLAVDITKPVRFFYAHSGLGRSRFKQLTDLEARIFMRSDGRVLFHPDRYAQKKIRDYVIDTAIHAGIARTFGDDATTGPAKSQPVDPGGLEAKRTPLLADETDAVQARRNAAALFLLEAAGLLEGPDPPAPGTR
jgi:hypothetical protein